MNFKNIALIMLLLPAISYCKSTEAHIKELEETQFQKELELSNLGEMIAKRDILLRSFNTEVSDLSFHLQMREIARLEEDNGGKELSDEERNQVADSLRKSINEFDISVGAAYENMNIPDGMLSEGLFNKEGSEDIKELQSKRFFQLRCTFERELIIKLVKRYEKCMQELTKINQELTNLKNRS